MTMAESLLCHILDCGYADLSILDRPGLDVDEIVGEIAEEGRSLTLEDIMGEVFHRGICQLDQRLRERKMAEYGKKNRRALAVLGAINGICPWVDIEWSFNYLDTPVIFALDERS